MEWERKYIIKLLNTLANDSLYRQVYASQIKMLFEILEDEWEFEKRNRLSSIEPTK